MEQYKKIDSVKMAEGQGATVNRLFPTKNYNQHHDPFVLMDEFMVEAPAKFSEHEHRGFEAITYMLEGSFVHNDNQGNNSEVKKGGVQAFNAGKSIFHSEKPGKTKNSHGIQLWVNLPPDKKKSDPYYQKLEQAPVVTNNSGIKIREIFGESSPLKIHTELNYLDIELKADKNYNSRLDPDKTGILYLFTGKLSINQNPVEPQQGLLLPKGAEFKIAAQENSRFFLISGQPHNQNINIKGSFVE